MAKLTISEAARVAGVARSTIQRNIRKGRLRLGPDHRLDAAELRHAGFLPHSARQALALEQTTQAELVLLRQERTLLREERARLTQQLERFTALYEAMQQALHALQQCIDRGREAPCAIPPASVSQAGHQVLTYMQQHPGPHHYRDVQQRLGWKRTARHVMRHLADAGYLRRLQRGVYTCVSVEDQSCP